MKDLYHHVVYYLFSLALFCTPARLSAQEELTEEGQPAREQKTQEERPLGEAPAPAAPPPPQAGNSAPETFTIPETAVTGEREYKYKADTATSATKTATPIRDIPQSVSVVTEELIKSQNAFSLRDALKNVSGLTIAAGEGGRTGDSITLRGFAANSDTYIDGAKDNGQYFRDTFYIDRVEVLKGASALLFGRGATGGVINQISKKPGPETTATADLTYGSFEFKRATVDVGGAVTDFLNVRLNALYQDSDSFRNFNFVERWGLAPALSLTLPTDTQLTLYLLHQQEDSVFDYGVPIFRGEPADVSDTIFYGFADDRLQEFDATVVTAALTQRFSENFSLKNTLRYGDYERLYRTHLFGAVTDTGPTSTVARTQALRRNEQYNVFNQTDLMWKSTVLGMPTTLLFGGEVGWENDDFKSKNSTGVPPVSIFNPERTYTVGAGRANSLNGTLATSRATQTETQAVYLLNQLEITRHWKAMGGVRFDRFDADFRDRLPDRPEFSRMDEAWSPRVGLVWQPTETQAYYFSYGTSFNPSAEAFSLNASTEDLRPEENRNFEVGAKVDFFDGNLTATAALFRLEKTNARTPDPNDPTLTVLAGEQRTDGFEFELAGALTSRWRVSAAYAYLDAEIVKANPGSGGVITEGKSAANTPRHSGVAWTSYRLTEALEIGGGVFFADHQFGNTAHTARAPGYWRFDAVLAYHHKRFDLQLNLFNLFDQEYYEFIRSNAALPGVPLSAQVTLRLRY
ncbi:MAG: TonB-dependent receptor [Candidatus Binatia bacterium]